MIQVIHSDEIDICRKRFLQIQQYLTEGEKSRVHSLLRITLVTGSADSDEWDRMKCTISSAEERRAREVRKQNHTYRKSDRSSGKKQYVRLYKTEELLLLKRLTGKRTVHVRKNGV